MDWLRGRRWSDHHSANAHGGLTDTGAHPDGHADVGTRHTNRPKAHVDTRSGPDAHLRAAQPILLLRQLSSTLPDDPTVLSRLHYVQTVRSKPPHLPLRRNAPL